MKIISKYKDFYDYFTQDHDADLTYVRNIGLVNKYLDDVFKKEGNYTPRYSRYYGYQSLISKYADNGRLQFDCFIFGVYPFVYAQPILRICYRYLSTGTTESIFIILGKDLVDKILNKDEAIASQGIKELKKLAQNEFDSELVRGICEHGKVAFAEHEKLNTIQNALRMYAWKVECQDIFYQIESPIFVKYDYDLFVNGAYWDNWPEEPKIGNLKDTHYVTDISLQKLNYNILKYWYNELFDLNTYINIENFLWSIKQEPEAKPDNKTKILAHGFDLKTSFRKM